MKKRAKQSKTNPTLSTKVNHLEVVDLLLDSTRDVAAAADLASLGIALGRVVLSAFSIADEHGLKIKPIFEAVALDDLDAAQKEIVKQCKNAILPYTRFPYARAGQGEVAGIIVRYAMGHGTFNVDDLLRLKKLGSIYGEEREGRKKLVAILHQMAKEKILTKVSPGELGSLGTPATYRLSYE